MSNAIIFDLLWLSFNSVQTIRIKRFATYINYVIELYNYEYNKYLPIIYIHKYISLYNMVKL